MKKLLNKLKCLIRLKHKPGKHGRYLDKSGNYTFKWKCERCDALLGLPHMTDEYIKKNFPIPPLPLRATNYKLAMALTIHKHEDFKISVFEMPIKYDRLAKTNKLLRELLRENEIDLKQIKTAQGVWRTSKDDGRYCP